MSEIREKSAERHITFRKRKLFHKRRNQTVRLKFSVIDKIEKSEREEHADAHERAHANHADNLLRRWFIFFFALFSVDGFRIFRRVVFKHERKTFCGNRKTERVKKESETKSVRHVRTHV